MKRCLDYSKFTERPGALYLGFYVIWVFLNSVLVGFHFVVSGSRRSFSFKIRK